MNLTSNTRAFIEAEQYSQFILHNLHDGLLPGSFYRDVTDFGSGDTLHIKTVGTVTLQETEENSPLDYNPIETGEVQLKITVQEGDAWYVTDDLREDGTDIDALMVARATESTRAFQEVFETKFFKTAAEAYPSADPYNVNGFAHKIVSAESNNIFSLDHLIMMRLAFKKANVPDMGNVFFCDPVVEATLNKKINLQSDISEFAKTVLQGGMSSGMYWITRIFGWDIIVSNRLYVGDAADGTTTVNDAVWNVCMNILDDQTKPIMAAWRRRPVVEGVRDAEHRRDKFTATARYGFGVQRMDTMGIIATSATHTEPSS